MATRKPKMPSPARAIHHDSLIVISSSPELPPLCDILAPKKDPLRSGSNAAPIPTNAVNTFTSAATLYRSALAESAASLDETSGAQPSASPNRCGRPRANVTASKTVIARLPVAEEPIEEEPPPPPAPKPRGRKRKAKEVPEEKDMSVSPEKPWLKYKASSETAMVESLTDQGGEVVPPAKAKATRKKKTDTVSKHFPPKKEEAQEPVSKAALEPAEVDELFELEPAMPRRTDWTPSKDTAVRLYSDSSEIREVMSPSRAGNAEQDGARKGIFKNLSDIYGRKPDEIQDKPSVTEAVAVDMLKKRKLVEMVAIGDVTTAPTAPTTPTVSPSKSKAPKKKARTITELATAAYRVAEEIEEPDSLLSYLEKAEDSKPETPDGALTGKAKASKKAAKPKTAKKKAAMPKRLLLSPSSAMQQASKQDIVFGTSSQLAMEDDPALLRALHEAMQASNTDFDNPFAGSSPPQSDLWARSRSRAKLWKASARDMDGTLLEVIDLIDSPVNPVRVDADMPPTLEQMAPPTLKRAIQHGAESHEPEMLDLTNTPAITKSVHLLSQKAVSKTAPKASSALSMQTLDISTNAEALDIQATINMVGDRTKVIQLSEVLDLTSSPVISKSLNFLSQRQPVEPPTSNKLVQIVSEPPASNQEQALVQSTQRGLSPEKPPEVAGPKYELFTDAQLAKEIKSYGFKPIKRRSAMIDLLNQCWMSKNKTASTSAIDSTAAASSSSKGRAKKPAPSTSSASRPKGRPKADSTPVVSNTAAAPQAVSPKRPRGRPKKDYVPSSPTDAALSPKRSPGRPRKSLTALSAGTSVISKGQSRPPPASTPKKRKAASKTVIEIADSESELSPLSSPGDVNVFSSPDAMDLSISEDTEISLAASPTDQQTRLFAFITKAVQSAPPTKNPQEPSWHEKMLMYDPVILEDLAAWLNAGQLDRVGYDGEVGPVDVKKWCESKSVCCLWRVNLHGKERKRL